MLDVKNLKPGYKVYFKNDFYVIKSGTVIGLSCGTEKFSGNLCVRVNSEGREIDWQPEYLTRSKEEAIDLAVAEYKQKLDEYVKSEGELKVIHNLENIIAFLEGQR